MNNNVKEPDNRHLQHQQQPSQKFEQVGIEMQNGKNGQHNVKGYNRDTEQVRGGEGRQKQHPKNNYFQARANPSNPTNNAHTNY